MPRRVANPLPPVEAPPVPGAVPLVPPEAEPAKRKYHRRTKEEIEAAKQKEQQALALQPAQVLPLSVAFLNTLAAVIKGDPATEEEIANVNLAATAVVNKYGGRFRYFEEVVLCIAVANTGFAMKVRARNKAKELRRVENETASRVPGPWSEGVGKVVPGSEVPVASFAFGSD